MWNYFKRFTRARSFIRSIDTHKLNVQLLIINIAERLADFQKRKKKKREFSTIVCEKFLEKYPLERVRKFN